MTPNASTRIAKPGGHGFKRIDKVEEAPALFAEWKQELSQYSGRSCDQSAHQMRYRDRI